MDNGLSEFEQRLGHTFENPDLLRRALTHKSFSHESKENDVRHNETYEFLGDSVLGFIVGDLLFRHFPELDEGALSKMKAFLVSASSLAAKAQIYAMGDAILLGVGEEKTGGRKKDSLLANVFEAVVAAVYLDGGVEAARKFLESTFHDDIRAIDEQDLLFQDYKTALQELAQGRGLQLPEYNVVGEVGPDHGKVFIVEVKLGKLTTRGEGSSKKEAQQQAAKHALHELTDAVE
ncbi:MAG: ribonuclease [Acidobacteriota bacterium]|nr:ribonuclease [Acidobacteriota bacterium]